MSEVSKIDKLKENIKSRRSMIVAFSGGVDSTFLLDVAREVLGDQLLAVTIRSASFPEREFKEALKFVTDNNIHHKVIECDELGIAGFVENPLDRCYLCKKDLFSKIKQLANEEGYNFVAEGSNYDDMGDYRPGFKAVSELGIISPLKEVGLTKDEIRLLSKERGLKTWDKPSFACLVSRIPYGEKITKQKLEMVDRAEQYFINSGFKQIRVRCHGNVARIEVDEIDFAKFIDKQFRNLVYSELKEIGFLYVALDLKGYRVGSMNEEFHKT